MMSASPTCTWGSTTDTPRRVHGRCNWSGAQNFALPLTENMRWYCSSIWCTVMSGTRALIHVIGSAALVVSTHGKNRLQSEIMRETITSIANVKPFQDTEPGLAQSAVRSSDRTASQRPVLAHESLKHTPCERNCGDSDRSPPKGPLLT